MNKHNQIYRLQYQLSRGLVFAILALALCSCKEKSETAKTNPVPYPSPGQFLDPIQIADQAGPDGSAIILDLATRYGSANSYSDQAVLYLTYMLQGQRIQEPQPWATTFDRSTGTERLAAQLFNGEIRSERNLLSCYVYDIETANLDNQQLLIPYENQLPVNQLFRDPIAKHFMGGYSELPLDETDLVSTPKLIPAPLSLLTNQVRNGWLQNPSRVQRLADETLEDKPCYVVRCLSQGMTADIWVDQKSKLLVQMSLPLKLLASEITVSPDVAEVVLVAKFHDAKMNQPVDAGAFKVSSHSDSTAVRKFVQLPEAIPSELIGQSASEFELVDSQGKALDHLHFDGKVTAFMWTAGKRTYPEIAKFSKIAEALPKGKFQLASIFTDSDLDPNSPTPVANPVLARIVKQTGMTAFYDAQLNASTKFGVKAIPSIVVMDGDSKIQFARTLSKNWEREVQAAMERVADGDDVASEMQNDYVRYLDSYHQQLATVSAADLGVRIKPGIAKVSASRPKGIRIRPVKEWASSQFKKAGNIAPMTDADPTGAVAYAAFDGWRTIVELDSNGQTLRRASLKLPVGEAANLIRIGKRANGENCFAVFATLGEKVYLFDKNWQPMMMYPQSDEVHPGIRDCRLVDLNEDGVSELVVAFDKGAGVHLVDPQSGRGDQVSKVLANSLISQGTDVIVAGEGKIGALKAGLTNVEETELEFKRVASAGTQQLCGLGVTAIGNWNAVGFDSELRRVWTLSVGSQFFETQIEPIAVAQFGPKTAVQTTQNTLWAIADTENVIHLVSGAGKWLGDFQSESQLHGVALDSRGGNTFLTICNEAGAESWNLNLESTSKNPLNPVSLQQ